MEAMLIKKGYGQRYKETCMQYAQELADHGLPVIFDNKHLSLLMGIESNILGYYIISSNKFYKEHQIAKSNGSLRTISTPSYNMKTIQRWILDNILSSFAIHSNAYGFVKGRNIKDNAIIHTKKKLVLNIDIKNFFPSIKFERVFYMFYHNGYTKEISYSLAALTTFNGALPQGAPSSPSIANIICQRMDKRLLALAVKMNADYSRYADDITISGDENIRKYIETIKSIIINEGFDINYRKLRLQTNKNMQEVTGLIVNEDVKVKRKYKKRLEQHIYYCKKFGVYSHLKKNESESKSYFKEYLYGMANFIKMIEPDEGMEFLEKLDEINWGS
ncbi:MULTISPECIES: retron St85 family RNA-directed DNA polymerase [Paenibacillus]|uniref:retron St85 family RNA-directed DNA polymerase n=1 Tax=Paenibacillus TaxID=44249 RepID=UPI0015B96E10|nr:retron St85 family RNA-directed DNA polymerase [Paenibacillus odorifer]